MRSKVVVYLGEIQEISSRYFWPSGGGFINPGFALQTLLTQTKRFETQCAVSAPHNCIDFTLSHALDKPTFSTQMGTLIATWSARHCAFLEFFFKNGPRSLSCFDFLWCLCRHLCFAFASQAPTWLPCVGQTRWCFSLENNLPRSSPGSTAKKM